jgi:hypothetical protein
VITWEDVVEFILDSYVYVAPKSIAAAVRLD